MPKRRKFSKKRNKRSHYDKELFLKDGKSFTPKAKLRLIKNAPICPYCLKQTDFIDSKEIYGTSYGMLYACMPCGSYVGCHKRTGEPLGFPGDQPTRQWRNKAHKAFDPLWQRKIELEKCNRSYARNLGYRWLAGQMGIAVEDCHVAMFDIEKCKQVIEICQRITKR